MDSGDVTAEQAAIINRWLVPAAKRLTALQERMAARGFRSYDPLRQETLAAMQAVGRLAETMQGIEGAKKNVPKWISARSDDPKG